MFLVDQKTLCVGCVSMWAEGFQKRIIWDELLIDCTKYGKVFSVFHLQSFLKMDLWKDFQCFSLKIISQNGFIWGPLIKENKFIHYVILHPPQIVKAKRKWKQREFHQQVKKF